MVMTRRRFLVSFLAAVAALAAGVRLGVRQTAKRVLRAEPVDRYPGPVQPLDRNHVRRMGPWVG